MPDPQRRKGRIWLCVPPVAMCTLDQALTLLGQSRSYWTGNYSDVNEVSPQFKWLLERHPLAFEAGVVVWMAIFIFLTLVLPRRAAMTVSMAFAIGHTWGAASWICFGLPSGYWITYALFLVSAGIAVWAWDKSTHCEPGADRNTP